jgi:hypothetical protein
VEVAFDVEVREEEEIYRFSGYTGRNPDINLCHCESSQMQSLGYIPTLARARGPRLRYLQIVEVLRDEFSSKAPVLQIDWTGIEDVSYLPALLGSFASGIWSNSFETRMNLRRRQLTNLACSQTQP